MGTKLGEEMKSFFLKVTSAISLDGAIAKAGQVIEVLEDDAKDLLRRGKAVLATEADGAPSVDDEDAAAAADAKAAADQAEADAKAAAEKVAAEKAALENADKGGK